MSANPFEHKHTHYHDDDEDLQQVMDPAQQSLADALKVSFGLLKVIMVILVLVYAASGFFTVKEQEVAVRLVFGRIIGQTDEDKVILSEGRFFWGWPFPIQQVLRVDTSPRRVRINDAFWHEGDAARSGPLNPERDGSILTGDANIIHARFVVNYRIGFASIAGGGEGERSARQVLDFIHNIGEVELSDQVVRAAAEEAVVRTLAGFTADDFLLDRVDRNRRMLRDNIQERLDVMGAGILITSVEVGDRIFPREVEAAFLAATNAQNTRGQRIAEARQRSEEILTAAAGAGYPEVLRLVDRYEELTRFVERSDTALRQTEAEQLTLLRQSLEKAFREGRLPAGIRPESEEGIQTLRAWLDQESLDPTMLIPTVTLSGQVAARVRQAEAVASSVVRDTATEAERFTILREEYRNTLFVVLDQRWQNMLREVLGEANRRPRFFLAPGRPYLELNIDPQLRAELERERIQRDREQRRQQPRQ